MSYNHPDANPGESDHEYEERVRQETEASTGFMFGIVGLLFALLKVAFIYSVSLVAAYMLTTKLWGEETDKMKTFGFTILFAFLIMCITFFIKGIILGLRTRNNKLWILLWLVFTLIYCFIPAYFVKIMVVGMFHLTERQNFWPIAISWIACFISFSFINSFYQFGSPGAPRWFSRSFNLGYRLFTKR